MMLRNYGGIMGQARIKGSFEARKKAAIESGRVKSNRSSSGKQYFHHPILGATTHHDEIMALALATLAFGRRFLRKRGY